MIWDYSITAHGALRCGTKLCCFVHVVHGSVDGGECRWCGSGEPDEERAPVQSRLKSSGQTLRWTNVSVGFEALLKACFDVGQLQGSMIVAHTAKFSSFLGSCPTICQDFGRHSLG